MNDLLQIVDQNGQTTGAMAKLEAHQNGGTLHRAISVFLFDELGRTLIQLRAANKYHFAGRWANACCSHPVGDETPLIAAQKTMMRELGIETDIHEVGIVEYRAEDPNSGLTECEYDHVFAGIWAGPIFHNPMEVEAVRWVTPEELRSEVRERPHTIAPWLPVIVESLSQSVDPFMAFRKRFLD